MSQKILMILCCVLWASPTLAEAPIDNLEQGCVISYFNLDPSSWTTPPIKVSPTGTRAISFRLAGIGSVGGNYQATSDNPSKVTIDVNSSGYLNPGDTTTVEGTIHCSVTSPPFLGFITANIYITGCIGQPDQHTDTIPLYAVCSNDYYECMRDPRTYYGTNNGVCSLWVCANTEEMLWDKRIEDQNRQQVIFSGGVIVATITPPYLGGETIVSRQDYRDTKTGARDTCNVLWIDEDFPSKCRIRRVCVDNTFIWYPVPIPGNPKWYWMDIRKQAITFEDKPGYTCDAWRKQIVFKQVWVKWNRPPKWWSFAGTYQGHGDIYYGVFADVNAPFDTGGNGYNWADWDATNKMMWQRGWNNGQNPQYENHYVGLAFTDKNGAVIDPYGAHDVLSRDYLYPQGGWGWQDTQLYRLASTSGVSIDSTDLALDRSMVLTAGKIAQGRDNPAADTLFVGSFILIEASDPGGLASLQTNINNARSQLVTTLRKNGILGRCGDANCDGNVNGADISYIINYLFVHGPKPCWPIDRGDVTYDHAIKPTDCSYLINYLFVYGPAPKCYGLLTY